MLYLVFILVHAAAGFLALAAGVAAMARGRFFTTYLGAMYVMQTFLLAAMAVGWSGYGATLKSVFIGLAGLGAFMCLRATLAVRSAPSRGGSVTAGGYQRHLDHVGFTLVGLTDAFVVITVLNAGFPVVVVVASAVVVAVAGHFVLVAAERRLTGRRLVAAGDLVVR